MDAALQIAFESGRAYTGLRGFAVDERLWNYVPRAYAQQQGLLPMLLVGDTLKLASSHPDPDLAPLSARFPGLKLDVVIAPAREIGAVLRAHADPER